MFERLNTPEELFNWQLGSALTMERDILEMLEDLIETARHESVKQALRSHHPETQSHVSNIEQAFGLLGWDVDDSPCAVSKAIEKEGKANIRKADDSLVDAVVLAGAIETEHHEIAVYENLIVQARALGHEQVAELLARNLAEEQQALQKLKGISEELARALPRIEHAGSPSS
jgi:ferritin-like metal-binding protein YciE